MRADAGTSGDSPATAPMLLADIGATNARFALERAPGQFDQIEVFKSADFPGIVEILRAYLTRIEGPLPRHAAVAIANPIDGDHVKMTNRDWQFSIEETRRALGFDTLLVVNDFTALAMALPRLGKKDREQIGRGQARPNAVIGLIGPGTGLGVSGLIPTEDRWVTLGSEGGHASFSPMDETEVRVLRFAWREWPHVSAERLVSGPGMELIYRALCEGEPDRPPLPAAAIVDAALAGRDARCVETVECFCGMLGTVASDVALTLGAVGGIYIGGGIVPRLGALFERSQFRRRFESKGRFAEYLAQIPTYVITAPYPAFLGVSAILAYHLRGSEGEGPLLERIRATVPTLSRAEQQVARLLLDQPRTFLNDPIADIARAADVSQPTVIRFCRTLGFQGLPEFKLKLASGLTGTIPVRHSLVRFGDSAPDLSAKVIDNTASAILRFRDALDGDAIGRAIGLVQAAARVELYGIGNSTVVALDGQYKFFRCGVPAVAYTDPVLQTIAAEMLRPGDVAIIISSSGRPPELLKAAERALAAGAAVVAITASRSPLARRATVALSVDHSEDSTTYISMIGRILHLLMIDVLAVGVAMRRLTPDGAAEDGHEALISHLHR